MALQGDTIHELPLLKLSETTDAELEVDVASANNGPRLSGRIKVSDLAAASGPGSPGTFTGYVEEPITAFPFTSAGTTSYANVLGLWLGSNGSVTGGKQRKPSADGSYAPDYTLSFDSAGHATVATVGTVPSPLPEGTCLLYTPGTAATTTTPTTPPAGGGGGTITVVSTTGSESITVVSTTGS